MRLALFVATPTVCAVRVVGLVMVRNEEDVVDHVVRHMLAQVDQVIVADNLSTDRTRSILDNIDSTKLVIVDDLDPAYRQAEKMTALAEDWAEPGDWLVPFDADELWCMSNGMPLGEGLRSLSNDAVSGKSWVHVPQNSDVKIECPFSTMPWRVSTPEAWPKAAFRWKVATDHIEQGNHWMKGPLMDAIDIRHFQYRSYEHLVAKVTVGAAALAAANLPGNSGEHWRRLSSMPDTELESWWDDYTRQKLEWDPPKCLA